MSVLQKSIFTSLPSPAGGRPNDARIRFDEAPLAHYIQNWDKASKGMDMSREEAPNLRVGFRGPAIIKG